MRKKLLNYGLFVLVVGLGIGFAVRHSLRIAGMVSAMAGTNREARIASARSLVEAEQFLDSVSGESVERRVAIVQALEDWAEPPAVKQLVAFQKDPDKLVRDRILLALVGAGSLSGDHLQHVVAGLHDGDGNVRAGSVRALQVLAETRPGEAERLLSVASPSSSPERVQAAVAKRNLSVAGEVVGKIVTSLKTVDAARVAVGDTFAGLSARADRSLDALLPLLSDKDEKVRGAAIAALGKLGDVRAVAPVAGKLRGDTAQIRRISIIALALIRKPACESYLAEALRSEDDDNEARVQAAVGLGAIPTSSSIDALVRALSDYDLKVQTAAASSLARHGDAAVPRLSSETRTANAQKRRRVALALAAIASPSADRALQSLLEDGDTEVRAAAARGLGRSNNAPAVARLLPLLQSNDGRVAEAASAALARIGPSARPPLLAMLDQGDVPAYFASEALTRSGSGAVLAFSQARPTTSNGMAWAARTLGGIGGKEAVNQLRALANSADPAVKSAAMRALSRLGEE